MRILNTDKFSEKFKIKPVNVFELDEVDPNSVKSKLSTYDIVKFANHLYMVFLGNDIERHYDKTTFNSPVGEGCFFFSENYNHFMLLDSYDESLLYYTQPSSKWSVTDVWFHDEYFINKDIKLPKNISQSFLKLLLETKNYKHLVLR